MVASDWSTDGTCLALIGCPGEKRANYWRRACPLSFRPARPPSGLPEWSGHPAPPRPGSLWRGRDSPTRWPPRINWENGGNRKRNSRAGGGRAAYPWPQRDGQLEATRSAASPQQADARPAPPRLRCPLSGLAPPPLNVRAAATLLPATPHSYFAALSIFRGLFWRRARCTALPVSGSRAAAPRLCDVELWCGGGGESARVGWLTA